MATATSSHRSATVALHCSLLCSGSNIQTKKQRQRGREKLREDVSVGQNQRIISDWLFSKLESMVHGTNEIHSDLCNRLLFHMKRQLF